MGISSKKSTTKENSTSTTTPNVPQYAADALKGYTGKVTDLMTTDPSGYVAPATANQTGAFAAAGNLGAGASAFDLAKQAASGVVGKQTAPMQSASLLENLDAYFDPYNERVREASLDEFDTQAARERARMQGAAASTGAFGGSRYGVAQGVMAADSGRNRNAADAALLSAGFDQATRLSDADATRRQDAAGRNQAAQAADLSRDLSASGVLSGLGSAMGADERANVGLQYDLGDAERLIDADYRTAPISLLQGVGQLLEGGQFGLQTGSTTTGSGTRTTTETPSVMSSIAKGVATAGKIAAMFSDGRLKRDVKTVGRDAKGRRWVSYRYRGSLDDGARHVGVIAQEVRRTDPGAVSLDAASGFYMVDYSKLERPKWA